jgi:hypothetical protein
MEYTEVKTLSVLNWTPTPDMPLDIWVTLYPNLDDPSFKIAREAFQAAGKQVSTYTVWPCPLLNYRLACDNTTIRPGNGC